jgi:hypothetical protein
MRPQDHSQPVFFGFSTFPVLSLLCRARRALFSLHAVAQCPVSSLARAAFCFFYLFFCLLPLCRQQGLPAPCPVTSKYIFFVCMQNLFCMQRLVMCADLHIFFLSCLAQVQGAQTFFLSSFFFGRCAAKPAELGHGGS